MYTFGQCLYQPFSSQNKWSFIGQKSVVSIEVHISEEELSEVEETQRMENECDHFRYTKEQILYKVEI